MWQIKIKNPVLLAIGKEVMIVLVVAGAGRDQFLTLLRVLRVVIGRNTNGLYDSIFGSVGFLRIC